MKQYGYLNSSKRRKQECEHCSQNTILFDTISKKNLNNIVIKEILSQTLKISLNKYRGSFK